MVKYRRVYESRLKRYAQELLLSGISIIFLLFMYLNGIGAITITGHSGDMVCAGTPEEPCVAYINFTANIDIYVYPMDTTWVFNTDKPMKEIRVYRKWGNYWRRIYFNKTWNKYVKYAMKFSKGKNYQLKIVGIKNDPYEDVKWGFDKIDPVWYGVKVIKYNITDENNATIWYYKLSYNGITVTTPVHTTCYWNGSAMRECIQPVYIENSWKAIKLNNLNFKYKFEKKLAKNIKVEYPDILSIGNSTVYFKFYYPANRGEEWNLSFIAGTYEWKIDPTISGCSVITSSGTYTLNQSITDSSTSYCINISANDVILDCDGHTIDGDGAADHAIHSDGFKNITIKNCVCSGWDTTTVHMQNTDNVTIFI